MNVPFPPSSHKTRTVQLGQGRSIVRPQIPHHLGGNAKHRSYGMPASTVNKVCSRRDRIKPCIIWIHLLCATWHGSTDSLWQITQGLQSSKVHLNICWGHLACKMVHARAYYSVWWYLSMQLRWGPTATHGCSPMCAGKQRYSAPSVTRTLIKEYLASTQLPEKQVIFCTCQTKGKIKVFKNKHAEQRMQLQNPTVEETWGSRMKW